MRAQTYEGYLEMDCKLSTSGQIITIPGRRRVFIAVYEEAPAQESVDEEMEQRRAWIKELEEAIDLSLDEELPDLPRSTLMREPVNLAD